MREMTLEIRGQEAEVPEIVERVWFQKNAK
jgi:hypothetical protein